MVFSGIYPEDPNDYEELQKSLEKLCLTDGSVEMKFESSAALGSGFRCGFLGMLHLDVFRQRLFDEYEMNAIITTPSIQYRARNINNPKVFLVDNPLDIERPELIKTWWEPICTAYVMTPIEYLKPIKNLLYDRRGLSEKEEFSNEGKIVNLTFSVPLSELIIDFFDKLKSLSQGYASLDYEHKEYQETSI